MTPLFLLPFDHRNSLARDVLGAAYPLRTAAERRAMTQLKKLVYAGFLQARTSYHGSAALGILVDAEFGLDILHAAQQAGIPFALTMEASGGDVFSFDTPDWKTQLRTLRPTFAKALVRYRVGDEAQNATSRRRLRELSQFCAREDLDFLLEVLVDGSVAAMMDEMRGAGVQPTLWKIEGQASAAAWKRLARHAKAPMIMLGRGESLRKVDAWLKAAAHGGAAGFAVGRSVFLAPLTAYHHGRIDRQTAIDRIAKNYLHCIHLWESYV